MKGRGVRMEFGAFYENGRGHMYFKRRQFATLYFPAPTFSFVLTLSFQFDMETKVRNPQTANLYILTCFKETVHRQFRFYSG